MLVINISGLNFLNKKKQIFKAVSNKSNYKNISKLLIDTLSKFL